MYLDGSKFSMVIVLRAVFSDLIIVLLPKEITFTSNPSALALYLQVKETLQTRANCFKFLSFLFFTLLVQKNNRS